MVCKMMLFDYRDFEKHYFEKANLDNFDIKFYDFPLNDETINHIPIEEIEKTNAISVFTTSKVNDEILDRFKNLRVISTRSAEYSHIDLKSCINKNIALVNVETPWQDVPNYILLQTFKKITEVLCGCRDNRVV